MMPPPLDARRADVVKGDDADDLWYCSLLIGRLGGFVVRAVAVCMFVNFLHGSQQQLMQTASLVILYRLYTRMCTL